MTESTPRRHHTSTCTHPDRDHIGACPTAYYPTGKTPPARTNEIWGPIEPISLDPDPDDDEIGILHFHGVDIPVLLNERGRWVSVPFLCKAMGVDGEGQRQNLKRKPWSEGWTCNPQVQLPGDTQRRSQFFIHERRVGMWLGNIDTARIKDGSVRARVEATQSEFADVLADYMETGQVPPKVGPSSGSGYGKKMSNRELALMVIAEADRAERAELLATEESGKVILLEERRQVDAPKVEFVEKFVDPAEGMVTFRVLAAQLRVQEKALRENLINQKIIYREVGYPSQLHAYAQYKGWFFEKLNPDVPRLSNGRVRLTLLVSPIGMVKITDRLDRQPMA